MSLPPLEELLPHRPPMLLLDRLRSWVGDTVVCEVTVQADGLFVCEGHAPGALMIEHMAQCVGVYAGLRAHQQGEPIRVGFLIGARELELGLDRLTVGDALVVTARHVFGDALLGHFECTVHRGDICVARASLSVYQGTMEDARP